MSLPLNVGDTAPQFDLATGEGSIASLKKLKGSPVVLYFYPKDDTSGCTKQAIGFSQAKAQFDKLGVEVIGVSADSTASHEKFTKKHDLTVTLGSDADKKTVADYGVWVEKSMYGRKYMGIERATYLIDAKGKIAHIWRKVKVPGHVEDVLKQAEQL